MKLLHEIPNKLLLHPNSNGHCGGRSILGFVSGSELRSFCGEGCSSSSWSNHHDCFRRRINPGDPYSVSVVYCECDVNLNSTFIAYTEPVNGYYYCNNCMRHSGLNETST